jgi:hypothetical protein
MHSGDAVARWCLVCHPQIESQRRKTMMPNARRNQINLARQIEVLKEDNRQLRAALSIYRLVMKRLDIGVRKHVRKR